MKQYVPVDEMKDIREVGLKLPEAQPVIDAALAECRRLYGEFDEKGKFYDYEVLSEFGRTYYRIEETDGVGEPYRTIGDWLEELTGGENIHFMPESFEDLIFDFIHDFIYEQVEKLNPRTVSFQHYL